MAKVKLYNSKAWMTDRYVNKKMTPEQIALAAGCTKVTVYVKLKEFGLLK